MYCFGLNNYQQLGFESIDDKQFIEDMPVMWTEIFGEDIEDIQGGENHTLVHYKNGDIYGAGKNDEGQLGVLDSEAEQMGSFQKLKHISHVDKLITSSHFNYALKGREYYAWGFGSGYVLGNGKEDSLTEARLVNNEKVFKIFPE